jgi:hypothetical protein
VCDEGERPGLVRGEEAIGMVKHKDGSNIYEYREDTSTCNLSRHASMSLCNAM